MPLSDFERVLRILREAKVFLLTLSGGEPFLHPEIDQILRLAHAEFEYATVLSNGTTITNENLATVAEIIKLKGFFPIQVSLDASNVTVNNRTRGMTSTVLDNLGLLRRAGASITVAMVVSSQNSKHIAQTALALKGVTRHFHIMPIKSVPYLRGSDQYLAVDRQTIRAFWDELEALRDEHDLMLRTPHDDCHRAETCATGAPCMAGFTQVVIDPNLDVRACDRCLHAVVGNLEHQSLQDIWAGPRLAHVYQRPIPYCEVPSEWESWAAASGLQAA